MPVLNRANTLPRVLEGVKHLSYPHKQIDMVFVDALSTDGTSEILQSFKEQNQHEFGNITLVRKSCNIPQGRNLCVDQMAEADYLWFLDSDVIPEPDSCDRLLKLAERADIASLHYSNLGYLNPKPRVSYVHTVETGCTLIKKEVFSKIGKFDETLTVGEDNDFCLRAEKEGFRIIQDTTIELTHLGKERYSHWRSLYGLIMYRSVYAKLTLMDGIYRRRFLLYLIISVATYTAPFISFLLFSPIVLYFVFQLIRRKNVIVALVVTLGSLIIVPLTLIGFVERWYARRTNQKLLNNVERIPI